MPRFYKLIMGLLLMLVSLAFNSHLASAQCSITNLQPTYCTNDADVTLIGGTNYYGTGVVGSDFSPLNAGAGTHKIYSYDGIATSYNVSTSGVYAPDPTPGSAVIFPGLPSDENSSSVPLGFTFNFFGTDYTSLVVNANGYVTFGGDASSSLGQLLPDPASPNNIIAGAWDDLDFTSGSITTALVGTAPFQKFIITYTGVPFASGPQTVSFQIQLWESINLIEIHSANIQDDGGLGKTQGIEDATGGVGYSLPARNNANWTASNDYVAFVPNCVDIRTVTVSTPPLSSLTVVAPANFCPGNGIPVNITAAESGVLYELRDAGNSTISAVYPGGSNLLITSNPLVTSTTIHVYATNPITGCSVTVGAPFTVTAFIPPAIATQPGPSIICETASTTFVVDAGTTTLPTYQWQVSTNGGVSYVNLTNAGIYSNVTTANLSLTNVTIGDSGYLYRVIVSGSCSPPVISDAATLTVNQNPVISTDPVPSIICAGSNTTFTVNAGPTTSPTYQWQVSTDGGGLYNNLTNTGIYTGVATSTLTLTGTPTANSGYLYRAVVGGACGSPTTSAAALLTVNSAAAITTQPVTTTTVCEDGTTQFTVVATGPGLTYQWREDGIAIVDGGVYSNSTTSILTLTNVPSSLNSSRYDVVVTGTCASVISTQSTLVVNEKPEITGQPSTSTICQGNNTSFTVNAGVTTAATYQWQVSTNGGTTYGNLANGGIYSGVTTSTLNLTNAPTGNNGYLYRVIVSGTCTPPVTSTGALLTINPNASITTQPVTTTTVCEDGTTQFTVVATGPGLTYQWREDGVAIVDGGVYSNSTTSILTLTNVPSSLNSKRYDAVVTGTCASVISTQSTLVVNEKPEITGQPTNSTICQGNNTSFTVNAGVTTAATYQWQVSTNGGTTYGNLANGGIYSGVTTSTLNLTNAPTGNNGYLYRVIVSGTCTPPVTSTGALLTINPNAAITSQPVTTTTVCEDGTTQFTVVATGPGLTYQWREDGIAIVDGGVYSNATTSILTLTNVPSSLNSRRYDVVVTGTCASVISTQSTLVVNEKPEITGQPSTSTICQGNNTSFTVNAGVTTAATYQWQVSTNGGTTYGNLANGGIYSGVTTSTLNLTNAPTGNNGYLYRVIVSGTCTPPVTSTGALLTINPNASITTQPVTTTTVCEDGTTQFTVVATGPGLTYQWREDGIAIVDGGVYSNATTSILTLTNVPSTLNSRRYDVVVTGTCASVISTQSTLVVNEKPEITGQPSTSTICQGNNTSFTVNAGVTTAATYQWQVSTNGGTTYGNLANGGIYSGVTTSTLNLTNAPTGNNGYLYRVIVSGTCTPPVTSTGALLTINPNAAITTQPVTTTTVCEDGTTQFTLVATGPGLTYQWREDGIAIVDGGVYSNATTSILTLTNVPSTLNSRRYDAVVTGTCASVISTQSTLVVNEKPEITGQPSTSTICQGNNTSFTVNAGVTTAATYQWQVSTNGGTTYGNLANGGIYSGVTTSTLNLTVTPVINNNYLYRVVVSGTCTPGVTSTGALLTVNQTPQITGQPVSSAICQGANTSFTVNPGTTTLPTYQWQVSVNGGTTYTNLVNAAPYSDVTTATLNLTTTPVANNGYLYRVVVSGTCNTPIVTDAALLTVNQNTSITSQPGTTAAVCEDGTIQFTVVASGTGLTYQWLEGATPIVDGGVYAGSATQTLTLTGVTSAFNTRQYRVNIIGACTPTTLSTPTTLTVNEKPEITSQPVNSIICQGANTTFTINAGVTTLPAYQWQVSTNGGVSYANLANTAPYSGVTTATLNVTATPLSNNGYLYRVIVSGACGPAVISDGAVLSVNQNVNISTQPLTAIVCEDGTAQFSVVASGSGLTYQWLEDGNPVSNGGVYAGATTPLLTLTNVTSALNAKQYSVVVNGTCGPTTSSSVALTVNEKPEITSQPNNSIICQGGGTSFIVASGVTTSPTYQWQVSTNSGVSYTNLVNNAVYSGVTTTTLALSATPLANNGLLYRVLVSGTCTPSVASNGALLTVNENPLIPTPPTPQIICENSSVTFTVGATGTGLTYQWRENGTNLANGPVYSGVNSPTLTIGNATAAFNGRNYSVVIAATCGLITSGNASLTVNRIPDAFASNVAICSGQTTAVAITNPNAVPSTTFSWTIQSVTNVSGATAGSGTTIAQTLTSTDGVNGGIVTYLIQPSAAGCIGTPYAVNVNVTPTPDAAASPQNICSGTSTSVAITNPNGVSGTLYNWIVFSSTNVTGASAGSGTVISQLLSATDGVSTGTVVYRITPSSGICVGGAVDVTVTVSPAPVITNSSTSLIQEICSNTALNFIPTSSISGTTYSWTSSVVGTLSGVSASGSGTISDTPVNATNSSAVIIYRITPAISGCNGNPVNYVVTVRPVTTASANPQIICSGSTTNVAITNPNAVAGTTYTWTAIATNASGSANGSGNVISQALTSTDGITNGSVVYTIIPSANGCPGPSFPVTVTIKPVSVLTNSAPSLSQQICSQDALSFVPTATIAGSTFTWTSTIAGPINVATVTASGSGDITDSPQNTGNTLATVTYRITPSFNGCDGVPQNLVVTVKPKPSASATPVTICSGLPVTINISPAPQNISGTTYDWTAVASANVTGAANGNGSTISQVLTTTDANIGTVVYTITPMANGCTGPTTSVTVTVNPVATVNAGIDYSVCEPVTIPITGTIGGSSTSATWSIVAGAGAGTLSGTSVSGTTVTATYTVNASDIGGLVKFRLTTNDPDGAGPCNILTDELVVAVNRQARVSIPNPSEIVCEPTTISLSGTLSGSATSGLWSLVTGSGVLTASSVTGSTVTASYTVAASDVNTSLLFRLMTNDPDASGPCVAEFADKSVFVNRAARVNAGADFAVCENQTINLNAVIGGATSSVLWSGGSGAAQFSNVAIANPVYTITPADITAGGVTLTITTNDPDGAGPPCGPVFDQVYIKINKLPAVYLVGLEPVYAENSGLDNLDGFPVGGMFTGPGIVAGTNTFNPANSGFGIITIRYTYLDPATGCSNFVERTTVVNPVTDVDFFILEDNRPNANGNPQICANQGSLTLVGIPPISEGKDPTKFRAISPALFSRIQFLGQNWKLDTDGLPAGTYVMQYIFTNQFDATDTLTKDLIVFSAPQAVIDVANNCVDDLVTFTESSSIPNNISNGNIISWNWQYGENSNGSNGAVAEPQYMYEEAGPKTVTLEVQTDQACRSKVTKQIIIGDPPVANFSWTSFCTEDDTQFVDKSDAQFGNINSYNWDFGDGNSQTIANPTHGYNTFGVYNVKLSVTTDAGCASDTTKQVYIQQLKNVSAIDPYSINFENGSETWVPVTVEGDIKNSWVFGLPNGDSINSSASGINSWWTGKNNQSYFNNEQSNVIGPCLNLTALKRPMISLMYWSDAQTNFDGAVVQYSVNGGDTWQTVGDAEGGGIDWYNLRNLPGQPGGQTNFAWSGRSKKWKNARYNLEQIPKNARDKVIIRVAFGSNNDNPIAEKFNGFAFDDVYVGEKTRNVLVENFANVNLDGSLNATKFIREDLYDKQFLTKDSSDFISVEYHLPNPRPDDLYLENPQDPIARALLYNISQPPTTIMDGIQNAQFNGLVANISLRELDRRALEDPSFDIQIDTTDSDATNAQVKLKLTYTYIDSVKTLQNRVTMHAAIIESGIGLNSPLVRKLLLNSEGTTVNKTWVKGDQEEVSVDYTLDVPISNPDNLSILAFIQESSIGAVQSKKILQSKIIKIRRKVGVNITGIEDNPVTGELAQLDVYPNPASQQIKLSVPILLLRKYTWRMIDQRGVVVLNGDLAQDFSSGPQEIDISGLANGIYFMSIQTGEKSIVYKKIAVMNKN